MTNDTRDKSGQITLTAGGAVLARMKAIGIDYIFANSGTDFPPIIEGLAEAAAKDIDLPNALIMPHENAAMGMAHGYYLATGKTQAVMAHTNVGLANCAIGAINAATEHVPVVLMSGRTPVMEKGRLGARTVPIGWGQEMRDQAALVRESSKWEYELKFPEQVPEVVDRAYAIASSVPKGPTYVSLPREVLCEPCPGDEIDGPLRMQPVPVAPPQASVEQAADILANAKNPVIIAQRGTGTAEAFGRFSELVDQWGIPVVQYWAIQLAIGTEHPMFAGMDPAPWLKDADAVVVIDCLAPWSPDIHTLRPDCKVVQIGQNPLYSRFPGRNFAADISLVGETGDVIMMLADAMDRRHADHAATCSDRRGKIATINAETRKKALAMADAGAVDPMTKAFVSRCLSDAIAGRSATVFSELGCPLEPLSLSEHSSWYQEPHSGGLGWSFPASMGYQLADKDKLVVATMGDGSYMFANPTACHQIAEALELPILILVLNNNEWGAVRQSVAGMYPNGYAAKTNEMPLTALKPSPDFTKVAEASRAWVAKAKRPEDLPGILRDAIKHIDSKRTHALVEVTIAP
ncbi:thiamine pyrophosphate-requiring protein [Thalassospira povalilytica]|uniref:Thiamine pyrophosphate-requiring protein n=1 Tax=Thalassospira povalilytica TaxID=732237 RepID=A0A8I1MA18_9PROT|nr:thiamine pyrophosphate-requiring protein [Thalassospira povalilytica]MBN8197616.1 thiamine pyrophosphate-requiring protein [Thalassospira povalilytica]